MRLLETDTNTNTNIASATQVASYTADTARHILVRVLWGCDLWPVPAVNGKENCPLRHVILDSELPLGDTPGSVAPSNYDHKVLGQLGVAVAAPAHGGPPSLAEHVSVVVGLGSEEKVAPVLARRVVATVQDVLLAGVYAGLQLIRNAMRQGVLPVQVDHAVALRNVCASPGPAVIGTGAMYLFPEPIYQRPTTVMALDVLARLALYSNDHAVLPSGFSVGGCLLAAAASAIAVPKLRENGATIGGVHWEFLSRWAGERRERLAGILCAPNYSTGGAV